MAPTKSHDLRLPDWGPYTKKYIGVAHIADPKRGWRFDLSVMPGLYRRKIDLPNVLWESGYHPWEASPGLDYFCHRHELEWKDQVYCDIAFARGDAPGCPGRFVRCECVNQTETPQGMGLHLVSSLQFPQGSRSSAVLPPGALWTNALDYRSFQFGEPRPNDGLVADLLLCGEVRGEGFVTGSGLGFGRTPGDVAVYACTVPGRLDEAELLLRFRAAEPALAQVRLDEGEPRKVEFFPSEGEFGLAAVVLGNMEPGEHVLEWTALEGGPVEWDGFALLEALLRFDASNGGPTALVAVMDPAHRYRAAWNGEELAVRERSPGTLELTLTPAATAGRLEIRRIS